MILDCVFLHRDVLEIVTSLASPRRPPSRTPRSAAPLCHPSLPPGPALARSVPERWHRRAGRAGTLGSGGVVLPGRPAGAGPAMAMEMGACLVGAAGPGRRRVCLARGLLLPAAGWCGRAALGHAGTQ